MLSLLIDTAAPLGEEFLIWVILNEMLIKQPWFRLYERRNLVQVFAVLWVNLLETKCYFWQLGQMRKSDGKRGADNCCSLSYGSRAARPPLYSESTSFLCQRGTREALNVTFRDARRFSLEAGEREKRADDVIADMCFKCQESLGHRDKWITRPLVLHLLHRFWSSR